MSEVKISNARRVGFTALVTFWVLTWREYSIACNDFFGSIFIIYSLGHASASRSPVDPHSAYLAASMALVPTAFLSIAVSNSLHGLRCLWIAMSAAFFASTILVARWLGLVGVDLPGLALDNFDDAVAVGPEFESEFARHESPSPWLLLPIILTSAFVIFGAWRRAVRDAMLESVGEDE